jgi:hypothetical protein
MKGVKNMKRMLFTFAGIMMVLALTIAGPGTAKALPIGTDMQLAGFSSVAVSGPIATGIVTITETNPLGASPWSVAISNAGGPIAVATVTSGSIVLNDSTDVATFSGNLSNSATLNLTGSIALLAAESGYYSWNLTLPAATMTSLNVSGAYTMASTAFRGGLSVDLSGNPLFNSTSAAVSSVPIPPALFLFAPALLGLVGIRKRLKG